MKLIPGEHDVPQWYRNLDSDSAGRFALWGVTAVVVAVSAWFASGSWLFAAIAPICVVPVVAILAGIREELLVRSSWRFNDLRPEDEPGPDDDFD
jgi:hypothetical protein